MIEVMRKLSKIIIVLFLLLSFAFIAAGNQPVLLAGEKQKIGVGGAKETAISLPQVVITASNGRRVIYNVEIADSPYERAIGLMFRDTLPSDRGMIFLFPAEEQQSFWMKDTLIELDMIFIRDDLSILGIVHSAKPFDESSHYVVGKSRYVLEINGGQAKKWGLAAGDRVEFVNIDKNAAKN